MTENKKRRPYVRPSMEVIKVETTSILAGSGGDSPVMSGTRSDEWRNGGEVVDIDWEEINQ